MAPRAEDPLVARRRVGIFGGTFDPPHLGHISVAREVSDLLELDEVLWIPARRSPHKPDVPLTPIETRLRMARAAAEADARFRVSPIEVARAAPSYTVETLRALARDAEKEGRKIDLFLIIGMDQYEAFDAWLEPDEIARLAHVAVMDRGGDRIEGSAQLEDMRNRRDSKGVVRVPVTRVDISSTEVRGQVAAGQSVDGLVPPAVAEIIRREGLYRG